MIEIWTDGSSHVKVAGGKSAVGYAALIHIADYAIEISAYAPTGTNNTAELSGAILALQCLRPHACQQQGVLIRTDSQYVIGQASGTWRTSTNFDLVRMLASLCSARNVNWEHVRGHSGDPQNERVDQMASEARLGGNGSLPHIFHSSLIDRRDGSTIVDRTTREARLWTGTEWLVVRMKA